MSLKLSLDEPATEAVHSMLKRIKEQYPDCNLSPSGLASWILIYFSEKLFEKLKGRIANHHFNAKAYLRNKLKDIDSPEQLEAMLVEVRSKLKISHEEGSRKGSLTRKDMNEKDGMNE